MNKAIRTEWLTELRSGNYTQGTGSLKKIDPDNGEVKHCCLGVLCEIAKNHGIVQEFEPYHTGSVSFGVDDLDRDSGVLPNSVINWAGLAESVPMIQFNGHSRGLAGMNDEGISFFSIANAIEENL